MELPTGPRRGSPSSQSGELWFQRFSRPTIFLIIALALVGAYSAFTIPVSVFPNTDFPRIVIGVDNGVAPIDQMLVTVTRPIEEAVSAVDINTPGAGARFCDREGGLKARDRVMTLRHCDDADWAWVFRTVEPAGEYHAR